MRTARRARSSDKFRTASYFFADYADEDQAGGYPVRVAVTLTVHGETLTVDFTGSDPQLASSLNMPTGGKERHSLATVGTVYALYCLDPTDDAERRPDAADARDHARRHGDERREAGGGRHAQPAVQYRADRGDRRLLPRHARSPARLARQRRQHHEREDQHQDRKLDHGVDRSRCGGGAGGGPFADGSEGCGANFSFLKNTPVEINEAEVPISIRRYGLVPDSGGPGRYRGGSALEMEFQLFAPQSHGDGAQPRPLGVLGLGLARRKAGRGLALCARIPGRRGRSSSARRTSSTASREISS